MRKLAHLLPSEGEKDAKQFFAVIENIDMIDKGCAEWFRVLDIVPAPRLEGNSYWGNQVTKIYAEHDLRLKRLDDLIQELWR